MEVSEQQQGAAAGQLLEDERALHQEPQQSELGTSPERSSGNPAAASSLKDTYNAAQLNQQMIAEAQQRLQDLLEKQLVLSQRQRVLEQRKVAELLHEPLGFDCGRPVAALLLHRCCLKWRALQAGPHDAVAQEALELIIKAITLELDEDSAALRVSSGAAPSSPQAAAAAAGDAAAAAAAAEDSVELGRSRSGAAATDGGVTQLRVDVPGSPSGANEAMMSHFAYWLTNTSTLLALLHKQLPPPAAPPAAPGETAGGKARGGEHAKHGAGAAAAAKIADLQSKLSNTWSALGKSLLKRGAKGGSGAGSAAGEGSQQQQQQEQQQQHQRPSVDGGASVASTAADEDGASAAGAGDAMAFRAALDSLAIKAYNTLRDSLKKQLSQTLAQCVQAPSPLSPLSPAPPPPSPPRRAPPPAVEAAGNEFTLGDEEEEEQAAGHGEQVAAAADDAAAEAEAEERRQQAALQRQQRALERQQAALAAQLAPWADLVAVLQTGLQRLREQAVPRILIKCIFKQVLAFINAQLFNQLLLRPECCCASNARGMLEGLKLLDAWTSAGSDEASLRALSADLKHARQAATFLVTPHKSALTLAHLQQMCPALNLQQLYRLCTTCHGDSIPSMPAAAPAVGGGGAGAGSADGADAQGDAPAAAEAPEITAAPDGTASGAAPPPAAPAALPAAAAPAPVAAVPDVVSGEVLEEMKRHHVTSNGGYIVTFLLDDDPTAIIATQGHHVAPEVLALIDDPSLHKPMELPVQLSGPDCPHDVFAFLRSSMSQA